MSDTPLTPQRLQQVKALFDVAVTLPTGSRGSFLDASAPDDSTLRDEVRSLLAAHDRAGDTLQRPSSDELARAVAEDDDRWTGGRIGAYEVIRRIGVGGMGAVYEAARNDDQYHKRVAIKFLKRSIESDLAIRRFRYERQILANLNHRNIAALLDGGVTPDGQPYFVMEHVAGAPITSWCDAQRLGVRQRVALFRQVCAAVQHAHQNLVVHRDLKPGNILVTDDGTVKLLDFGIAKLLREEEGPDQLPPTQGGIRAFTPEYASPEQVRGLPVGTTSDVYALGVVLFELLAGRRPFVLEGKLLPEIEQVICNEPPPLASSIIDARFAERAGERSVRRAKAQVEGDLDAITATALRKEPARRYGSADQLAADLRRHLDGMPVSARREGLAYRFGKLVRRRRIEVAAGVLTVLALGGGIIATSRQARRAAEEGARATAINAFLVTMLGAADPGSLGRDVTMREVLDSAAVRADSLRNQPALEAEIRNVIGNTYLSLGEYTEAKRQFERALVVRQLLAPNGDRDVSVAMAAVGGAVELIGELELADSILREGYRIFQRTARPDDPERATQLGGLAVMRQKLGDLPGAEALQRQVLAARRAAVPPNPKALSYSLNDLAVVLGQMGRVEEADSLHRETITVSRDAYGEEHPVVASAIATYAAALDFAGRTREADSVYRLALGMKRKLLGAEHPDYAWTVFNYAQFLVSAKRWVEAAERAREVLALQGRTLPETHPAIATAMQALGISLDHLDSLDAGGRWLRESLALRRRTLPKGHWLVASGEGVLGEHFIRERRYAEAEPLLLESERLLAEQRGDRSPQVRDARARLVTLYTAWGKPEMAVRWKAASSGQGG